MPVPFSLVDEPVVYLLKLQAGLLNKFRLVIFLKIENYAYIISSFLHGSDFINFSTRICMQLMDFKIKGQSETHRWVRPLGVLLPPIF